jgi:acid phosphatase type 7
MKMSNIFDLKPDSYLVRRFFLLLLILSSAASGQIPTRKGWWKFDDPAALTRAEAGYGSALVPVGAFIAAVSGPVEGDGAARVGVGTYLKMNHGIAANGGGAYVNEYTLQFDFKVPAIGDWYAFFQTNRYNTNDGDCFVNTGGLIGVGATGYSGSAIRAGEWYRLVISVKNGSFFNYYLDGQLLLTGTPQNLDERFAIEDPLLIFADENGEDGTMDCAQLAIWDSPLTAEQVKKLGGYGHTFGPRLMTRIPYLQAPTPRSIQVCWHDSSSIGTRVEYGTSASLGETTSGSSELLSDPYRWHAVKLDGLQPDTEYYYRVVSGNARSAVYNFRTLPEAGHAGKLRMLLLSDTHSGDTTNVTRVMQAARSKIEELYGPDIHNQLHLVLHSGDLVVSGNSISNYTDQFFSRMAGVSPYIPFMTVAGNHEGENAFYYRYMKYDDVSALAPPNVNAEKIWWLNAGNACFIGLNTNIVSSAGALQKSLLDVKLSQVESDTSIDFVFIFFHHLPWSELWGEGVTNDAGSNYIKNELFPVIKKYTKVQQLTYGHTHAFERGTVESNTPNGDFRIVCAGGGGGETDNWGEFENRDYPFIHIALDHYFFQILEIDAQNRSYEISMYSLGNASRRRNVERMDHWYRKLQQAGPGAPVVRPTSPIGDQVVLNSSPFAGPDSLMTVRVQVADNASFLNVAIDTMAYWQNLYGVDAHFEPIDRNRGIDLTRLAISDSRFTSGKVYYYRVKYRDHNLMWSPWSNTETFSGETGVESDDAMPLEYELAQNYPNPFNNISMIAYQLPQAAHVSIRVYNLLGQEMATLVDEAKNAGHHQTELDASRLSSGMYFYEMCSGDYKARRKFNLVR